MLLAHFAHATHLIRGLIRLHKQAKVIRKLEASLFMQGLKQEQRMRIIRRDLVALQRTFPQIEELDGKNIQLFSDEELEFYAALLLDKDNPPTTPYDNITDK
jgi:uncharacterized protein YllA (UPF0747 family)